MLPSGLFAAEGAQLPQLKALGYRPSAILRILSADLGVSKSLIEVSEDEEIRREIRQRLEAAKRN